MALGAFALQVVAYALIAAVNGAPVLLVLCFMIPAIVQSSVRAIQAKILDRDTTRAKDDGPYSYCSQGNTPQDFPALLGRPWPLAPHDPRLHNARPACCRNKHSTTPSSERFDHESAAYSASLESGAFPRSDDPCTSSGSGKLSTSRSIK